VSTISTEFVLSLALVGIFAGAVNSVVGSGGLVTFPFLVASGVPPLSANIANNLGVIPGIFVATFSYRKWYAGEGKKLFWVLLFSALGGAGGAILLITLPAASFEAMVPVLLAVATSLVIIGPFVKARTIKRTRNRVVAPIENTFVLNIWTLGASVYGGYFGAGQGVVLLGYLGVVLHGTLQRANAYKNAIVSASNTAAALIFLVTFDVYWPAVGILAVSSAIGGFLGGRYGQKIPEAVYRLIIVVVGVAATISFLATNY